MDIEAQAVVVGVTDRGENTDALRFALREAAATGRPLRLVHVAQGLLPPVPPSVLVTPDVLIEVGKKSMHAVREELEELLSELGEPVELRSRVTTGDPGRALAEQSKEASLVVLQHRSLSRMHRMFTGSTVATAATHAHCPVVSVSAATGGDGGAGTRGRVVAGVLEGGGPPEVAEIACDEAERRRAAVRLVHGWHLAPAYDPILAADKEWRRGVDTTLENLASDLQTKHPGLHVAASVEHAWPVDALVSASREADLLVLGRHRGTHPGPPRLGSLTRALLAYADCPVMVVPL
jgi:nucleotide-binding universal stress UspA family protein